MAYYQDYVAENFVPTYRAVHDIVDTGTAHVLIAGAARIKLPNDGLAYEYFNYKRFYDKATSNIKDSIPHANLTAEFNFNLQGGIGDLFQLQIVVPNPLGEQLISNFHYRINRVTVQNFAFSTNLYNRPETLAHEYGFDIYVSCTGGNITMTNRPVKVIQ